MLNYQWVYFGVLHFQTNLSERLLDFKLYQTHETQPWLLFRVPRHFWTHTHVESHYCWWLPHASLLAWSTRPSPAAEPLGHLCKLICLQLDRATLQLHSISSGFCPPSRNFSMVPHAILLKDVPSGQSSAHCLLIPLEHLPQHYAVRHSMSGLACPSGIQIFLPALEFWWVVAHQKLSFGILFEKAVEDHLQLNTIQLMGGSKMT